MEAPAATAGSRSRVLGHSSVFSFLRSLVGNRGGPKSSGQALEGGCAHSPRGARREPGPLGLSPRQALGPGKGGSGARTSNTKEVLRLTAQVVTSVLPRGGLAVLANLSEMERGEEEEEGEQARASRASDRHHLAQAPETEHGCPQRASPAAFAREEEEEEEEAEEEEECLLEGNLRLASAKMKLTPWNHLLSLYKQLQKSVEAKEDLFLDKQEEDELTEEEDGSCKLCVPDTAPLQSPPHRTARPRDGTGFVESELKKLLAVQQESGLWKLGRLESQELLAPPPGPSLETGLEDGQHLLFEEMDETRNWPPE